MLDYKHKTLNFTTELNETNYNDIIHYTGVWSHGVNILY